MKRLAFIVACPWTTRGAAFLAGGLFISWMLAWVGAMVRPTDDGPNIFGTKSTSWNSTFLLPRLRLTSAHGDYTLELLETPVSTTAMISPLWNRSSSGAEVATDGYFRPSEVPLQFVAAFPKRSAWCPPPWAALYLDRSDERDLQVTAWGWPARCLLGVEWRERGWQASGTSAPFGVRWNGFWVLDRKPVRLRSVGVPAVRLLPIQPIWTGLLLNASFFGSILLIAWLLTSAMPRFLRARRGLCTRCAYDLKGLPPGSPCPECGVGTSAVLTGLTHKTAAITEPSPHDE